MTKKTDKTERFVDNKGRKTKENNKMPNRKDDADTNKKNVTIKSGSYLVNEIQVSDTDSSMTIGEEDDTVGWWGLPEILELTDEADLCDWWQRMTTWELLQARIYDIKHRMCQIETL